MAWEGNTDVVNGFYSQIKTGGAVNANWYKAVLPPIGSVMGWLKTFDTADSGTTSSATTNKLIQTGQNFLTTISVGMIVYNTTDSTWSYVTAVDSDTQLSIANDIMANGENYTIYTTPVLPEGWIELTWGISPLDGSGVLTDSESPYNGATFPNLNGAGGTKRFLRGSTTSGTEGGADTAAHVHTLTTQSNPDVFPIASATTAFGDNVTSQTDSASPSILPSYYEVVWIVRIK